MCLFNGLYISALMWHSGYATTIEDRSGSCAYTHETHFYQREVYSSNTVSLQYKQRLRHGLYIKPALGIGIESHKFSKYYNDLYIIATPLVKLLAKLQRGVYFQAHLSLGKGFYTLNKNNSINAPNKGYTAQTVLGLGITMSTDWIFNKLRYKRRKR